MLRLLLFLVGCHLIAGHRDNTQSCRHGECSDGTYCKFHWPCELGTCSCDSNDVLLSENRRCSHVKALNEGCISDMQCYEGAYCEERLKCMCIYDGIYTAMSDNLGCRRDNQIMLGGSCAAVGSICVGYKHGRFITSNTLCTSNVCECAVGYMPDVNSMYCVNIKVGDPCTESADCPSYNGGTPTPGDCTAGTCVCNSGYTSVMAASACVKIVGDTCTASTECPGDLYDPKLGGCVSGTCQCFAGFTAVNEGTDCVGALIEVGHRCENLLGNRSHYCMDGYTCATCPGGSFPLCMPPPAGAAAPVTSLAVLVMVVLASIFVAAK